MTIEEVLKTEGKYVGPTFGVSMRPMLKQGRDTIVVRKVEKGETLPPLSVALYKRGESYILHRVLSFSDKGYVIRGDNCYGDELVPPSDVLGVLTEYFKKNKHILCTDKAYLRYARRRVKNYPRRRFFKKIETGLKRFVKKLLGKK